VHAVWGLAIKDLKLISRDWLGMFFILGFPVCMGLFFGYVFGSMGESGQGRGLVVAVVDEDQSPVSQRFIKSLESQERVKVIRVPLAEAAEKVRRGQLVGFIVVPKGFGESAGVLWEEPPTLRLGLDPSRFAESAILEGMVMQAMGGLIGDRFQDAAGMRKTLDDARSRMASEADIPPPLQPLLGTMMASLDEFLASLDDVQKGDTSGESQNRLRGLQLANIESVDVTRAVNPDSVEALTRKLRSKWDISFPQATQWGILACAAGFAVTMVRERTLGTMVRLQVAPIRTVHIIAGKSLACLIGVLFVSIFMIALGMALGMRPRNMPLLALASLCIAVCFVGIMMLMSVVGKSEEAVAGAAWGANVLMAMFGGGMLPLAFMPSMMRTLSHISPVKWSVLALEGAIWRGFSFGEILPSLLVLVGVGAVCFAVGTLVLQRRLAAA
jgi:ABC-2 type transport system permease protein